MATLPRPTEAKADYSGYASLTRIWQLIEKLENFFEEAGGRGVLEGGAVTATGAYSVQLAAGTLLQAEGLVHALDAAVDADTLGDDGDVLRLYGLLTRTSGGNSTPLVEDTWEFALAITTNDADPPSAQHIPLAVITLDASGIETIEDPPDKYLRHRQHGGKLSITVTGTGAAVTLTEAQARNTILELTGDRGADLALVLPAQDGRWHLVLDHTTGGYQVTVRSPGGDGWQMEPGATALALCAGGDYILMGQTGSGGGSVPGDEDPGLVTEAAGGAIAFDIVVGADPVEVVFDHADQATFDTIVWDQAGFRDANGDEIAGVRIYPLHRATAGSRTDGSHICLLVEAPAP